MYYLPVYRGSNQAPEALDIIMTDIASVRILTFSQPFECADGVPVLHPAYHVIVITDEGTQFRHFYRFEGWSAYEDSDGNSIVVRREREARARAAKLAARIEAAIERDGIYGLDRQYWEAI